MMAPDRSDGSLQGGCRAARKQAEGNEEPGHRVWVDEGTAGVDLRGTGRRVRIQPVPHRIAGLQEDIQIEVRHPAEIDHPQQPDEAG